MIANINLHSTLIKYKGKLEATEDVLASFTFHSD